MLLDELGVLLYWILYQFKMIFPYWAAGVVAGSMVSVFLSPGIKDAAVRRGKGKISLLAILPAAVLGAASPICMYGTVPLIASLGRKGVPQHLLASFMISSILINPNLFVFSLSLGVEIAATRLAVCIAAGVAAGILTAFFFRGRKLFNCEIFEDGCRRAEDSNITRRLTGDINRAVLKTAPYFLSGILLAALFECYFPKDAVADLFGPNRSFGIFLALSMGIPVYVCGGGTIPLLKTWLDSGMSHGSAIAFMLSGPATKITNLGAVKIILGIRNFILYLVFNILFAFVSGWIVDRIYLLLN